jgi:NAD+ synthase
MDYLSTSEQITSWLKEKLTESGQQGFTVGVSGGVDSAVVSTLCAKTGFPTLLVEIPITSYGGKTIYPNLATRGKTHIDWLISKHSSVYKRNLDLTFVYDHFIKTLREDTFLIVTPLVAANLQSRLRMCALYAYANAHQYLVVGTGNKVEDYGIGFFTKGGDGCVDLSPIGDLKKSEVTGLASYLDISQEIVEAAPSDGLWEDGRTDEDQIGASYKELEWAMAAHSIVMDYIGLSHDELPSLADRIQSAEISLKTKMTERQKEVLTIYHNRHIANRHKMEMPPICKIKPYQGEEVTYAELEI